MVLIALAGLERVIANKSIVFIRGEHTVTGGEQAPPLDINTARQAILQ